MQKLSHVLASVAFARLLSRLHPGLHGRLLLLLLLLLPPCQSHVERALRGRNRRSPFSSTAQLTLSTSILPCCESLGWTCCSAHLPVLTFTPSGSSFFAELSPSICIVFLHIPAGQTAPLGRFGFWLGCRYHALLWYQLLSCNIVSAAFRILMLLLLNLIFHPDILISSFVLHTISNFSCC